MGRSHSLDLPISTRPKFINFTCKPFMCSITLIPNFPFMGSVMNAWSARIMRSTQIMRSARIMRSYNKSLQLKRQQQGVFATVSGGNSKGWRRCACQKQSEETKQCMCINEMETFPLIQNASTIFYYSGCESSTSSSSAGKRRNL